MLVLSSKDSFGKKGAFKYVIGCINNTSVLPFP